VSGDSAGPLLRGDNGSGGGTSSDGCRGMLDEDCVRECKIGEVGVENMFFCDIVGDRVKVAWAIMAVFVTVPILTVSSRSAVCVLESWSWSASGSDKDAVSVSVPLTPSASWVPSTSVTSSRARVRAAALAAIVFGGSGSGAFASEPRREGGCARGPKGRGSSGVEGEANEGADDEGGLYGGAADGDAAAGVGDAGSTSCAANPFITGSLGCDTYWGTACASDGCESEGCA
jgi:hypothetical protein